MTQSQIAKKLGTSAQYVSKTIKKGDAVINKTFVRIVEALGYDIRIVYEKKREGIIDKKISTVNNF